MPDSSDTTAVEVRDLVKRYPRRDSNAVDGLSFRARSGEIFGLLGPNGAGKTTTVGILTTRVRATGGSALLAGIDVLKDPVAARARLAVVPQRSNLDRALTPRQNLTFHAAYHGVGRAERRRRAADLLAEFGLADQADIKVDWYSGGMAQRLMIARALIHEPEVLFLDEPTTGLDPQARLFVWERVREMRARGVTVVLTTHDMDEAADLCDRVGIVDHGRLLALDTPEALTRTVTGRSVLELTVAPAGPPTVPGNLLDTLTTLSGVERGERLGFSGEREGGGAPSQGRDRSGTPERLRLYLTDRPTALLGPVVAALNHHSAVLTDVHIGQASLEDVFINLTGRGLR